MSGLRGRCSQLRHKRPRTHQKKRGEGFPATTKASRDTQTRRERKEEREREKRRKRTGVPSYEQASRDTPGRGVNLSITFRNTPKGEGGREGVDGGRD